MDTMFPLTLRAVGFNESDVNPDSTATIFKKANISLPLVNLEDEYNYHTKGVFSEFSKEGEK